MIITTSPEGNYVTNLVLQGLSNFSIIPNEIYEYVVPESNNTRTYTIEDRNLTYNCLLLAWAPPWVKAKTLVWNYHLIPLLILLELWTFLLSMTFLTIVEASLDVSFGP